MDTAVDIKYFVQRFLQTKVILIELTKTLTDGVTGNSRSIISDNTNIQIFQRELLSPIICVVTLTMRDKIPLSF